MKGRRIAFTGACAMALGGLPSGLGAQVPIPTVPTSTPRPDLVVAAGVAPKMVASSQSMTRRALIIAIGDYPASSGYSRLHVSRDVELVSAALVTVGFDTSDISVLRDANATREGIITSLERLIANSRAGDQVVLHYSGHGHRISDDNGDELDGYDEILVPYGAPAALRADNYRGDRHIRDDELGALLGRLRAALGRSGSVTVLLDACFSGSGTRGLTDNDAAVRGVADPIVVDGAPRRIRRGDDNAGGVLDAVPVTRGSDVESGAAGAGVARIVVISAARHDQVARETHDEFRNAVGSLSLATSRVLPLLIPSATFRVLFDRITTAMAGMSLGDQRPQMEGAVDAVVFNGGLVAQQPFLRVARVLSDSVVELAAGSLVGVLPGTRVAFHAPGTNDPKGTSAFATGRVRESSVSRAVVALNGAARGELLRDGWVFVTEYTYGEQRVRISVDRSLSLSVAKRVRDMLAAMPLVELVESRSDFRVSRSGGTASTVRVALIGADSTLPDALGSPLDSSFRNRLHAAVSRRARSTYLTRMVLNSPDIRVQMELVRTAPRISWAGEKPACSGAAPVPLNQSPSAEGIVMSPRDEYTLRFTNEGKHAAHIVVLDLQPNGKVTQIFPDPEALGSDNVILPGRSFTVSDICYFAEEPYGTEVLKLFATTDRVDFLPITTGATPSTRSATSPLEMLFEDLVAGTRGAVSGAGVASTYGITLRIVPRTARPVRKSR